MIGLILGKSPLIRELLSLVAKLASSKTNVLILGESGTGKELVARMIHETGILKEKPFIPVNCGAIHESLIESEMFGHKRGSFTGAVAEKIGLFEAASGGTLFLDEVGELPASIQVKLLRALQDRTIRRVGGNDNIRVDVRIIAATNRNLEEMVANGKFREDLFYRLNVIQVRTPPLRERPEDIPELANHFLRKAAERSGSKARVFNPEVMEILKHHPWPGNVRELENVVERAVALVSGESISVDAIPEEIAAGVQRAASGFAAQSGADAAEIRLPAPDFSKGTIDLEKILGEVETAYLVQALAHSGGVKKAAAELLGITFRSMRYRLKKAGIEQGGDED